MDGVIIAALAVLLVLACPLMMVGMGAVAWVWARAQGRKKDFSMGCMGGKCDHAEHQGQSQPDQEGALRDQVDRLQAEVDSLRWRADAAPKAERK